MDLWRDRKRVVTACRRTFVVFAIATAIGSVATGADLEQQAKELEAMLIAPCCFTQQVSLHHSAAADEVRLEIRRRLAAGETREQILAAFVQRYGKRILAEPPAEGFSRLLYVLPPIALVLTAAFIVAVVHRFTTRGSSQAPADRGADLGVEDRYGAELDDQLRDFD